MTRIRKIFTGIAMVLLLCAAFSSGAFWGFKQGYGYRIFQASVGDSYSTLRSLEMINAGDINEAKKHLEMELDSHLIEHWSGMVKRPFNLGLVPENETAANRLMSRVAAYRKTKPPVIDNAKVKEAIETVVMRYQK